jgi:clan AA aspartic protease
LGLIYADIEIINSADSILAENGYMDVTKIRKKTVSALVDSGAYMLTLPAHLANQLGLRKLEQREAELADGSVRMLDIVGPVDVRFENRSTTVRAMVVPNGEPLLGAIPMEDMDVLIHPREQKLVVNPENPYVPKMSLK